MSQVPPANPGSSDPRATHGPLWYGEQDENGVDLSLIRSNLKVSVEQRLRQSEAARQSAIWLLKNARPARQKSA